MGKPIEQVRCPLANTDKCPQKGGYCSHMVVHNRGGACTPDQLYSHPKCPDCVKVV